MVSPLPLGMAATPHKAYFADENSPQRTLIVQN